MLMKHIRHKSTLVTFSLDWIGEKYFWKEKYYTITIIVWFKQKYIREISLPPVRLDRPSGQLSGRDTTKGPPDGGTFRFMFVVSRFSSYKTQIIYSP